MGVQEIEDCEPERPMPVLTIHGQQGVVHPHLGNDDLRWGYSVLNRGGRPVARTAVVGEDLGSERAEGRR